MKIRNLRLRAALTLLPCLALPWAVTWAQEPAQGDSESGPQEQDDSEPWVMPEFPRGAPSNPQQEMIKAFQRVEKDLETMSLLLLEASRGDTSRLANARESGIEDLLKLADKRPQGDASKALSELLYASSAGGQRVLDGIDEIIEIAESNGNPNSTSTQPQSGGGGQGQQGQQPSGQPNQTQDQSGQRHMQGQERPQPESGEQPDPNGEQPNSNQDTPGDPNQPKTEGETAPDPNALGTPQSVLPGRESWGNLPIHVRDIFRADGSADMPARYRSWIDSYYRKLNRENAR